MLDDELMHEISYDLPQIPYVFISSITGYGIPALKDILWRELNSDEITPVSAAKESLVHRRLDIQSLEFEPEEEFGDDLDDDFEEDDEDNYYEEDF